jgi:S1-C subfamily serine protease
VRILLAPKTPAAEALLDRLCAWSAAGLLAPFCWWYADGVEEDAILTVTHVSAGAASELDIQPALGEDLSQVAALAIVPASDTETFDTVAFLEAVRARLAAVAEVLPFRPGEVFGATLLVVADEVDAPVDRSLFGPYWNASVYVAAEDRSNPEAANRLKGDVGRLPGHAAHAVTVIADLWSRPTDPEEQILTQLSALSRGPDRTDVTVVRCYSRAIDFGYLASHLAAAVFQPGDGWPNPDPEHFDRRSDAGEPVGYIVRQFIAKHKRALGLSDPDLIEIPGPRELTLWQAIKEVFRRLLDRLRNKPVEMIQDAINDAYNRAADRVEKAGGTNRDWRIKRPDRNGARVSDLIALAERLDKPMIVPDGPVQAAWTDLRLLSLGLTDGSPLPDGLEREILVQNNKRAVITRPAALVPDPARRPPMSEALPDPRACDPWHLDPRFTAPAPAPVEGEEPAEEAPAIDRAFWSAGHAGTPVWEIGASIAQAIEVAARAADATPPTAEDRQPQLAQSEANERLARKADRRRVGASALAASALAGVGGYEAFTQLSWVPRIAALVAIVVLWIVAMGRVARRIIRRRDRSALELLQREIAALNAAIERSTRAGDRIRLERRYREYLDWAEILGWFTHHPWTGEPLQRVPVQAALDASSLPAALRVANARTRERLPVLGKQAQGKIFHPNWLAGLYDSIETRLMSDLAELRGLGPSERPIPAADLDQDPEGARVTLRDGVRLGTGRRLSDNPLSENLLRFLDGSQVEKVTDGVAVVDGSQAGEDPDASLLAPSLAWFSEPDGLAELASSLRRSIVRIRSANDAGVAWGGSGVIISGTGLIATARHVIEGATEIIVDFTLGGSAIAAVQKVAAHTDLALLTAQEAPSTAVPLAASGELQQGDPVITLGHPLLQEGEPSLAWGIVTATDRRIRLVDPPSGVGTIDVIQASYKSAGGASGAPVFDLSGKIVAIHVASTHEQGSEIPDFLASAVPVDQLRQLIDTSGIAARPAGREESSAPVERSSTADVFPSVSAFLGELDREADGLAMLHQHWKDPSRGLHRVREVRRTGASGETATVSELTGTTGFYRPLKAVASRVEVAGQTPPDDLGSCTGAAPDGPITGPAPDPKLEELG